jgi:ParB-like chromosome segregation protein Spo0J
MTEKPYQLLPPLAADEYAALKADIAERGVQVPVEYDEHGNVLDGHHRIQICVELGIAQWPRLVRHGLSEVEKRSHARRLNLHRRHLDQAQRRALITDELRDAPAASDRAVAAGLGVDHKTVATVRAGLEATGEIPQLDARKGRDGRERRIVQFVPSTPGEKKGLSLSARYLNERDRTAYREGARSLDPFAFRHVRTRYRGTQVSRVLRRPSVAAESRFRKSVLREPLPDDDVG